jgi:ATP adenylyltransferase
MRSWSKSENIFKDKTVRHIYAPWRYEYLISKQPEECLFCSLKNAEPDPENLIIRQGTCWYVMLNKYPYTNGHLMVVCKRHLESFSKLQQAENEELTDLLRKAEAAIRRVYNPHGINIGANLGRSAGAGIEGHLHFHFVPRWFGDSNFMTSVHETRVLSEDLKLTYRNLKEAIGG